MNTPLSIVALRTQLAARSCTQTDLAHALGVPPTTLSGWLRGAHPSPEDLVARIERALALESGALAASPSHAVRIPIAACDRPAVAPFAPDCPTTQGHRPKK